ncbi:MAG: C40 family peptidase [Pseudomonadota bacterium]|nr:C40 family peptidase [Pseudomonadota bacterium]
MTSRIIPVAGPADASRDLARSSLAPPQARMIMVDGAIEMLGQPYRWGGAAPGGFDCSGLVKFAATGAGIHIPRTAHEQLEAGESIAPEQVRAGDLVFMHLAHKELHVGIAIDRERFVHAPSNGGYVRIDLLTAAPYAKGFAAARRIVAP